MPCSKRIIPFWTGHFLLKGNMKKLILTFLLATLPIVLTPTVEATVASTSNKSGPYAGNGVTTNWVIDFPVNGVDESEINGYLVEDGISTLITTNFDVDLQALTYTYPTVASGLDPIATGVGIIIVRDLDLLQETDLRNQGPLPAETLEAALDRITMITQQLQEQINRTALTDISEEENTTDIESILADVNAAAAAAAASAEAAAAAAETASGVPSVAGKPLYVLRVKSDETGYELVQKIPYASTTLTGSILNADVNSSAAITYSKLNLSGGIVNADINASAAIVGTKLAQITTAGKVSGAALTSLSSIPSGAGRIPIANLATGTPTGTKFVRDDGTLVVPSTSAGSNVIYQWHGNENAGVSHETQSSLTPGTTPANKYFFVIAQDPATATQIFPTSKWVKISGVNTITVKARMWQEQTASGGSGHKAIIVADIGGQTNTVSGTDGQQTPEEVSFTVDVSSLTNGNAYDIKIYLWQNNAENAYLSDLMLLGS